MKSDGKRTWVWASLSLVLLFGCFGCSSTEIVHPGPLLVQGDALQETPWLDPTSFTKSEGPTEASEAEPAWQISLPLTIAPKRPWWQKTLFWAGPGH